MAQGIQNFYNSIQKKGILKNFQFRVVQIGGSMLLDDELVLMKSATLPGKEIINNEIPFMGVKFNVPGAAFYPGSSNWNVSFWETQDFTIRNELENLITDTFDDRAEGDIGEGGIGNMSIPGIDRTIEIDLLGDNMEVIRTYFLIGCYVRKIDDTSFDLGGSGDPIELKASIAYQYWSKLPGSGPRGGNILERLQGAIRSGTRIAESVGNLGSSIGGLLG